MVRTSTVFLKIRTAVSVFQSIKLNIMTCRRRQSKRKDHFLMYPFSHCSLCVVSSLYQVSAGHTLSQ